FTAVAKAQPVQQTSLAPQPACFRIGGCPGNGGKTDPALLAALQTLAQGQQQIIQLLIALQHPTPVPIPAPSPPAQIAGGPPVTYHIYMPPDQRGYAQPPLTIPAPPVNPPLVIPAPPVQP